MKKKKEENVIKYKISEIVKCEKMKILIFNKILEKDNIIILENDKYFIVKSAPISLKLE